MQTKKEETQQKRWTITSNSCDLGSASLHAGIPYTTEMSYTGSYRDCSKMAGWIRRYFISVNQYNPIRVDRTADKITYRIIAHFGMLETVLLTINKEVVS